MGSTEHVRALVIGGGVIGCAVLRELVRQGLSDVLLVEAESDVCEGTSKANSAIVHTGFDATPGTTESRLLRRAAELWPATIEELGVPFLAVGALMLARGTEELDRLREVIAAGAAANGVRTELLSAAQLRDLAPYVTDMAVGALSIPDEGIIDPFWLTRGYAEAAVASGAAAVRLQTAVTDLVVDEEGVLAQLEDGSLVRAEQVFDCAGISADEVAAMAGDRSFAIAPRKGQFLVSEETFGVDRIVLPIPGPLGKGMLVTPIVFGGVLLGPTAEDITDKDDRSTDGAGRSRILDSSSSLVPAVRDMVPIRSFAGLRHVSSTGDYILRPSAVGDRLWIVAGIRSTGISASPAIAEEVVRAAMAARGWARPSATRVIAAPPLDLPDEPGEVVCLCRSVSRGEILAAIRRPIPAVTLDAVKRRCGAMLGDCQGNMCSVDVARIVAHEGGLALTEVEKGARGSWIFSSEGTRPGGADGELPTGDVVIIGARHAGSAAAEELSAAGLRTVVVERHEGHTAIGIVPGSADTTVLVQSATGTTEVRAQAVIVATGGFVEPGEHRAIDGGRPAGVVTWDFAMEAALRDHGIGDRRVYVVGRTTLGRSLMESSDHGPGDDADFVGDEPGELLGAARLEAIRSGDRWIDCDTLVFADRQVANTMLLRSLGVVDGRPGVPAPVDRDGRLPIRGIYAAGCCVRPDIDHERCAADGAQVGRFVAMELKARATG